MARHPSTDGSGSSDWDGVWKRLFEQFPAETLRLCGVDTADGATIRELPTEQQRPLLPDRVFQVTGADGRTELIHIEVQVQPERGFELRLAAYYALLARRHHRAPRQVVVLPEGGPYSGRFAYGRLRLEYDVVDVPTLDPGPLLAGPLAPLALWSARVRPGPALETVVETILDRIGELPDVDHQAVLVELAVLRGDEVAILVLAALERRNMSNVLEGTPSGRKLLALGEARGEARGEALVVAEMLRDRFGDEPGLMEVAERLVAQNGPGAFRRVLAATTLTELRS